MIFNIGNDSHIPRIGIVGCGFSGTLALANIVAKAKIPLVIEVFEKDSTPATGTAYGTQEVRHLLNVPAAKMGAFADNPEHFFQWLQTEEGRSAIAAVIPGQDIAAGSFAPRQLYAHYLKSILDNALEQAKSRDIEIHFNQTEVVDAALRDMESQQLLLSTLKGGIEREILVDALVLATGNLPPRRFGFQPGLIRGVEHYVADIWRPRQESLYPDNVNQLPADSEIVIIGTGLTAIDTIMTLKQRGYKGTITALSRHGLLPAAHSACKSYPEWEWTKNPEQVPHSVARITQRLRREIKTAQAQGYDWRSVIDSLRPVTQVIWKRLSPKEKRRFLRRLFTYWNIHRHRMAPEIHADMKSLQQNGTLRIMAGKIYYVGSDDDGLTVAYRRRGTNRVETIRAAMVLNCTGPEYDIAASSHRLLKNLRDRELITIGRLRIGIETTADGTAHGKANEAVFPMGTLLVGELLECTAVPELRQQAADTATAVLKRIRNLRDHERKSELLMGAWI